VARVERGAGAALWPTSAPAVHIFFREALMIRHDVVFALRMLRKAPGFTLAAVIATALAIGANTAIFTVVKHVLLQPLPYPDPNRIVDVNEHARGRPAAVSPPNFMDWRAGNQTLSALSAYSGQVMTLSGRSEPARVVAGSMDASIVDVMGVRPLLGRAFTADDTRPGGRKVVILGYGLWQRAFGGDPGIVSRQVSLEGEPYEVVGVMPGGYDFPDESELWIPLRLSDRDLRAAQRGAHYLGAVGRLKPGVTAAQTTADLDRIEQEIARQHPDKVAGYSVAAVPLLASMVETVERPLFMLFGAVGVVLLIACVNVSNLLPRGDGPHRRDRSACRARCRTPRPSANTAESIVSLEPAVPPDAAGSGVALMSLAPPDLPRASSVQMDASVLVFSVVLSIVVGVLFGVAPAIVASRPDRRCFSRRGTRRRRVGRTPTARAGCRAGGAAAAPAPDLRCADD
jgi:putative ABC transport system permease protein